MISRLKVFYSALFFTTIFPFTSYVIPIIPTQFLGFNLTGWAWMMMLFVAIANLFYNNKNVFPIWIWIPWVLYLIGYLILDFSFLGLQLSLQYILPLLIGIISSGFKYTNEDFEWIFKWFIRVIAFVYSIYLWANIFGNGYMPGMAMMPMLFSIAISLLSALFFLTHRKVYLLCIAILFIAPVTEMTRMGIAATFAIVLLHFSNKKIASKFIFGSIGVIVLMLVFSSKKFQEKTFYGGQGKITDLTLNYYENQKMRSTGRISWRDALSEGLKDKPVFGNGPRADNIYLSKITGLNTGEAHNDYLSVRFNYGYIGLFLLLLGFGISFISLFNVSRKFNNNEYIFFLSTSVLTLYFAFLMFMLTDNILKYTIYFPNYFFSLSGIVYSLKRDVLVT